MSGLRASIELLRRELRNARVKMEVDFHSMIIGSSSAFVDLFRYPFFYFYMIAYFFIPSATLFIFEQIASLIDTKRNVAVAQSDSSPKYSNGSEQNPLLARSNTVQVTTPLVKRNHQPLNVLPLSDVNLSVETTDSISQPLLKIEDRHSPEVTKLCSGDGIKMPTSVVSHNSDKLHKLPDEGTSSYRSRLCYHGDVCYRENVNLDSQWTKPALMDYRSKVLGSDDNSDLYKSHSFSYLNNKNDCSVYCSNSNNARFDVDQSLEQQISRISHMLAETQILLNGRRPIPRS
nr:hypothetical transcript [Hymenolepis microstoma]